MKINVLYEDNHLIAVFKPAGLLTQGDRTRDINLLDEVKKHLKEKYKKPGNVFLGLLHRLDRPVSGIVLFAKTSKGASRLSEQFRNQEIEKTYHAVVIGKPKQKTGNLVSYLQKDEKKRKATAAGTAGNSALAELFYELISSNGRYSLLKIKIKGGKFHQIRAQLSLAGFPILGDVKYGAPFSLLDRSIALCADAISFRTATTKETKKISIPLPQNWGEYVSTSRK